MRAALLFLVVSLFAGSALAQPTSHPFYPLAEGNTWVHDLYGGNGHRTMTVVGWDTNADGPFWRMAVSLTPLSGGMPSKYECGVRLIGDDEEPSVEAFGPSGCLALRVRAQLPSASAPQGDTQPFAVTGQVHDLYVVGRSFFDPIVMRPVECSQFAHGIGVVLRRVCSGVQGGGGDTTERIAYAAIGDVEYGVRPEDYFALYDPAVYTPLVVGNRWVYRHVRTPVGMQSVTSLHDFHVTAHNPSTQRYTVELRRHQNGELVGADTCLMWNEPAGRLRVIGPDTCRLGTDPSPAAPWSYRFAGATLPQAYAIGEGTYDLNTLTFSKSMPRNNAYDNYESTTHRGAWGVGLLSYNYSLYYTNAGVGSGLTLTLLYAEIGDTVYGQNPVSSETPPAAERAPLAVYPNPSRDWVVLAFASASAERQVEVFDGLGRRIRRYVVAPSESAYRLDVSGLAAGTYIVRVGGDGETHRLSVIR